MGSVTLGISEIAPSNRLDFSRQANKFLFDYFSYFSDRPFLIVRSLFLMSALLFVGVGFLAIAE